MTRLDSELSGAGHSAIVVMLWMRRMVSSWVKPEQSQTDGKIKAQLVRAKPAVGAAGGVLSPRSGSEWEGSRQEERLGPETSGELKRRRGARRLYSALPALLSDWLRASPSRFPPWSSSEHAHTWKRATHTSGNQFPQQVGENRLSVEGPSLKYDILLSLCSTESVFVEIKEGGNKRAFKWRSVEAEENMC